MTHLPFIAASYAATLLAIAGFGLGARKRRHRATIRLRALYQRAAARR